MGRRTWSNRATVEECLTLDTSWLNRHEYFCDYKRGTVSWTNGCGETFSSIAIEVSKESYGGFVRLQYTTGHSASNSKQAMDYRIRLEETRCQYGGVRYWFLCPLTVKGKFCGKRVGKIYLPPGGAYFGCRHCYDLTYRCQKEHDSRIDRLLENPQELLRKLEGGKNSILAVKAAAKYLNWS